MVLLPVKSVVFILMLVGLPATAQAQQQCAPHQVVVDALGKHGERVIQRGLVNDHMLEVWRADDGGFTIVITRPDKITCAIASGRSMHPVPPPTSEDKS